MESQLLSIVFHRFIFILIKAFAKQKYWYSRILHGVLRAWTQPFLELLVDYLWKVADRSDRNRQVSYSRFSETRICWATPSPQSQYRQRNRLRYMFHYPLDCGKPSCRAIAFVLVRSGASIEPKWQRRIPPPAIRLRNRNQQQIRGSLLAFVFASKNFEDLLW